MINIGNIEVKGLWVGSTKANSGFLGNVKAWGGEEPTPIWLCFTAEQANSTVHLDKNGSPGIISLETSTDGNTWTDYSWTNGTGNTLTLTNVGDKVYMRANTENQTIGRTSSNYYKFVMTGKIAASGNIQTLLKADGSRTDAPEFCYRSMFYGCSSLTTAPELPATTLAEGCYNQMFANCTSLTTAPELPAMSLSYACYNDMFYQCYMLNEITIGYTGDFSEDYFTNWVDGVASSGTFYYNGSDTTTGTSAIPTGWTVTPFTP